MLIVVYSESFLKYVKKALKWYYYEAYFGRELCWAAKIKSKSISYSEGNI